MKHSSLSLFIIILCTTTSLFSQSPYKVSWDTDGYILGGGGAAALAGFLLDRSVSPLTTAEVDNLDRESINRFDRSATYRYSETAENASDVLFGIAVATPFLLLTDRTMRTDWRTVTLMYLETCSFIGASTMFAKGSVERFRPFVYNSDVPINKKLTSDARKSFFSGHTTVAFASAVFLSTVYSDYNPNSKWRPYLWASSLFMASVVGYSRYGAGAHFPTDILLGAIVGSAIGYVVPWMHRAGKENLTITPNVPPRAEYGFSLQVRL